MSSDNNGLKTTEQKKTPYLTQPVIYGMHAYRRPGEDSSVYFVDEERGIRKMLVDQEGNIQNFPGIIMENFWVEEVAERSLEPQVRFRTYFEFKGNGWTMYWQVQPDGRYWGDDGGFGIENDESDRALVTGFLIWLIWDKLNSWKLKRTEDSMN